jgi:hypothetical protein
VLPVLLTVIQASVVVAVQTQLLCVVTVNVPPVPAAPTDADVGSSV